MTVIAVTDDAFLGGRLSILQPASGYRAGLDAILLAAAVAGRICPSARILDAGAGVGVVGLCVAHAVPGVEIVLVEQDAGLAQLASRNVERNGLGARIKVAVADVSAGGRGLHEAAAHTGLGPSRFDHVVCNPPYYLAGLGTPPSDPARAMAHQMDAGAFSRWAAFLATAARANGALTIIHRADALPGILKALEGRFGGICVSPIYPRADEAASRIIVTGRKGSRAPMAIRPGIVLHDHAGRHLPNIEAVLREGAPLLI